MARTPRLVLRARPENNLVSLALLTLMAAGPAACVGVVDDPRSGPGSDPGPGILTGEATGGSPFLAVSTGGRAATGGSGTGGSGTGGEATGGASTGGSQPSTGGAGMDGTGGFGRPGTPDGGVGTDGGSAISGAGGPATTWTEVYSMMLNSASYASNCTGAACHNPGTAHNVKLSTAASGYTSIRSLVTPGTSTAGSLVRVLMSGSMPRGRPAMPAADLARIQSWITAGALNN